MSVVSLNNKNLETLYHVIKDVIYLLNNYVSMFGLFVSMVLVEYVDKWQFWFGGFCFTMLYHQPLTTQ